MSRKPKSAQKNTAIPGKARTAFRNGDLRKARTAFRNGDLRKARQLLQDIIKSNPKDTDALNLNGRVLMRQGDPDAAVSNFTSSLALNPDNPACLNALGYILFSQGHVQASEEKFRASLSLAPNFVEAVGNLGLVTRFLGKHDEALPLLRRAASGGGATAKILEALANEFIFHSQPHAAREILSKLVSAQPWNPLTLALLGKATGDCGDITRAETLWARAQTIDPGCAEPDALRARALQSKGDIDGAIAALERTLVLDPSHAPSLFFWAHVADGNPAATLPRAQVIGMIEDALDGGPRPHDDHTRLRFAAGRLFDKAGRHDQAIEYYAQANSDVWALRPIEKETYSRWHENILSKFNSNFFDRHRKIIGREPSGNDRCGNGLVFIVGMPRSGTTLVEQIFSRADNLFAGGERPDMDALSNIFLGQLEQGTVESEATALPMSRVRDLAGQHHAKVEKTAGPGNHFTDKSPRNFMNLGMIACLFPQAKIIHCVRSPVDTCLSCYFNYFSYNAVRYSYDLETLACFYSLYLKTMDVWRDILPIPILDVIYEDLVETPEKTIREMVEFGEYPWDEKFLHPEDNRRAVHTASVAQVRNPINGNSVGRWSPYEAHLQPLLNLPGNGARA